MLIEEAGHDADDTKGDERHHCYDTCREMMGTEKKVVTEKIQSRQAHTLEEKSNKANTQTQIFSVCRNKDLLRSP